MKKFVLLMLCTLVGVGPIFSENQETRKFSVGLDLVGLSYDQILIYFETPISENLSADFALGYSPGGLWSPDFKYWYVQTDLRNYYSEPGNGLYSGFGLAAYFGEGPLKFTKWKTTLIESSSVVVGVLGEVGYKYFLNQKDGLYVDSNIFAYTLAPLQINLAPNMRASEFQYSQFSALGNVIAGYTF